ncbi:MAG: hypothetical protein K2K70_13105 [Lachnospiraceae bacterium]|nr:hypothetical protein [Lachnospiraceae bacterium]
MKNSTKRVWKILSVTMVLVLVLSLSACKNNKSSAETKSLYTQGLEVIQLMFEMTQSEEYIDLCGGTNEIKAIVQNISTGDYTTPKAVYAISISDENLATMAELNNLDNPSKELKAFLLKRILGSLITRINGMDGADNIAASSICTAGKTFVYEKANEDLIYLYTYDNATPVAVTFSVGEDHAISANGIFVINDKFSDGSADEIKSSFRDIAVEVTEVIPEKSNTP